MANDTHAARASGEAFSATTYLTALESAVQKNPLSAALIGMGALWLFTGGSQTRLFRSENGREAVRQGAGIVRGVQTASSQVASGLNSAENVAAQALASTASTVSHAASEAAKGTLDGAANVAHFIQDTSSQWRGALQHSLSDLLEKQPLVLGLIGMAVGAGIAASFSVTPMEQQLMGEASESVQEQAGTIARQAREIAGAVVSEVQSQI